MIAPSAYSTYMKSRDHFRSRRIRFYWFLPNERRGRQRPHLPRLQRNAAALSRNLRRIPLRTVRQRHFLDGKPRKYGRIYAWKLTVLQAWNRPRPTRHLRVARCVSLDRHAAPRSKGHHIREPGRRDTGKVHSTTAVMKVLDSLWSPKRSCFFRAM
jgi:hypothetical protein